jgi:hypothetical protein
MKPSKKTYGLNMVFTISFLSKYGELGGFFPEPLYVFTSSQNLFILVVKKRKENTDSEGKK